MKKLFTLLALTISFSMNAQTGSTFYGSGTGFGSGENYNSAFGAYALTINTSGEYNSAFGYQSLYSNTTGEKNNASGVYSLYSNTTGSYNSASGYESLYSNTTGANNTAIGLSSLKTNFIGDYNVAIGNYTLENITQSNGNVAVGYNALRFHLGNDNIGIGKNAGTHNGVYGDGESSNSNNTGDKNIYIGKNSKSGFYSFSEINNEIVIGADTTGNGTNSITIGNSDINDIYLSEDGGATIWAGNATFNGDVVISSDARLKSNIVSLGSTLTKLLQIDGKSYEMKGKQKIGVLAQEIQEVFPELVSEDDNEMLAVNYQGLVPVLINALKEQAKIIKSQEARLTNIENLIANLNE